MNSRQTLMTNLKSTHLDLGPSRNFISCCSDMGSVLVLGLISKWGICLVAIDFQSVQQALPKNTINTNSLSKG
jgi:hypothetical protein